VAADSTVSAFAAAATSARARQYLIENGRTAQQHAANFQQWLIDNAA
jgi:hypothetical protein